MLYEQFFFFVFHSSWQIERTGERTCSVVVDSVGKAEEGEWSCDLQSYPYQLGERPGMYSAAVEYTRLVKRQIRI